MRTFVLGFFIFFSTAALFSIAPAAAEPDAERFGIAIAHRIEVELAEPELAVTHTVTVSNKTTAALRSMELKLPVSQTTGLNIHYAEGGDIPFVLTNKQSDTGSRLASYKSAQVDFPQEITGRNQSWRFVVSYTTKEGVWAIGDNLTIMLPNMDGVTGGSWTAEIRVPQAVSAINYKPPAHSVDTIGNERRFSFRSADFDTNTLGLSFAKDTSYSAILTTQLRNRSPLPRTFRLSLPADLHNQSVYIGRMDPSPLKMEIDTDGNSIAVYRLWPFQSMSVTVEAQAIVEQLRYDPAEAGNIAETPDELKEYVRGGRYWTTQSEAGSLATSLINPQESAWENVKILHDFVRDEIAYTPDADLEIPAHEILEQKTGNAHNIADLLITMLRSQGVPARLIEGVMQPSSGLDDTPAVHAWTEAYVPGVGWATLDPVWSMAFRGFGYSSFDRLGVTAISNDEQRQYHRLGSRATFRIEPQAETLPEPDENPFELTARRYIFLPGIALDRLELENNSGYILDNVAVDNHPPGSLAPWSINTSWQWRLTGFNGFDTSINYDDRELKNTADVVWQPLLIAGATAVLAAVVQFYRYRSGRYLRRRLRDNGLYK